LTKKFKEKGVSILVGNQKRPHEKRPQKGKQSEEHVKRVMFTHITGMDEILVIDCVSEDFDQPIFQPPNFLDTQWRDIATNLLRFARSCDSDFTDTDENLGLHRVTYGFQISPSEFNSQNVVFSPHDNQDDSVETSDASSIPGSLPDLMSVDDEASMNETPDLSEVVVNEASDSLSAVLSSDDEASVNEASGSLTAVVSGDVEAANAQPPLFFIVYVTNSTLLQPRISPFRR